MKVNIIGAGIAGLCAAVVLKKAGIQAELFEAAPSPKAAGAGLGLAPNAIRAMEKLGIAEQILPLGTQLPYFNILNTKGKILAGNDSSEIQRLYGMDNFAIHRHDLHKALLAAIGNTKIHTGKKLSNIAQTSDGVAVEFEDGSTYHTHYVIAADGIYSRIRKIIAPDAALRYAGYTCWRGIADGKGTKIAGATETWGKSGRFGIVPLSSGQVYWFACVNAAANDPAMKKFRTAELIAQFSSYHSPIGQLLRQTSDQALIHNDLYDIAPLDRFAHGRILLTGDAAHAATPNMGQGACQAIEDAAVLLDELQRSTDIPEVFANFENRRLAKTRMIIEQSRTIGKVAQLTSPILARLRNLAIGLTPASVRYKKLEAIYHTDF
jgi:2-polyprenyl-6-methoxyphenol hydroxylase-like FAD-dependent oxidoreductase